MHDWITQQNQARPRRLSGGCTDHTDSGQEHDRCRREMAYAGPSGTTKPKLGATTPETTGCARPATPWPW